MDYALAYNINRMARLGVGGLGSSDLRAQVIEALFGAGEDGLLHVFQPPDIYQTDDTSTPVTATTQSIGRADDLSGNGNHATEATPSERPAYDETGGFGYALPDGVNDRLISPFNGTWANGFVVAAAFSIDESTATGRVATFTDNVNGITIQVTSSAVTVAYQGATNEGASWANLSAGTYVVVATLNTALDTIEGWLNGVSNTGTSITGSTIGASSILFQRVQQDDLAVCNNPIHSVLAVDRELSDLTERTLIEDYFKSVSGAGW